MVVMRYERRSHHQHSYLVLIRFHGVADIHNAGESAEDAKKGQSVRENRGHQRLRALSTHGISISVLLLTPLAERDSISAKMPSLLIAIVVSG